MKIVRPFIKSAIEKSSLEELLIVKKNKNYNVKLSKDEQLLVEKKICEHCKFYSFAFKKCEASIEAWRKHCISYQHED